jgi:hypothetical protein
MSTECGNTEFDMLIAGDQRKKTINDVLDA